MKTVYTFGGSADHSDPRQKDKTVAGGKGANLAEMAQIGLPVPPGFTITTDECVSYLAGGSDFSEMLRTDVAHAIKHIEETVGKSFGNNDDPLLVSVRSGARVSMPGMMDTVLNLGLNDETVKGLANTSGDERFAWDSYRRFIQMYGDVVLGVDHGLFEEALEIAKEDKGLYNDTEMNAEDWQTLVGEYKTIVQDALGHPFPQDVQEQLWGAIAAVFDSWDSDRAKVYRRLNDISAAWGTAVNVQAMVFG
ncbi:MAG: PEP/pyruvate-binding domain-containing protein, partial [Pontixanthobacter sp.]